MDFKIDTNRDDVDRRAKEIRLYLRGEKMIDGDYRKFPKVIKNK